MFRKYLPSLVVPGLLVFTGILGYLSIVLAWNFELIAYVVFFLTMVYIMVLEKIIPLKYEWKSPKNQLWPDLKHFVFSVAIFDALGKVMAISFVLFLQKYWFTTSEFLDSLPLFIAFVLANIIGEFFPYLYHRISHVGNLNSKVSTFLWKIHAIHHLPERLNWFKTNWIHPINMFLNVIFKLVPLMWLGFNENVLFLVAITHIIVAYISHANIKTDRSIWDYIIVTPQIHHFHHSKKMEEAKNFGNTIPFWDLVFRTYYNRNGVVEDVGVVESGLLSYPPDMQYINQMAFPIRNLKSKN